MVNHGHIVKNIVSLSNVTLWKPLSSMINHGPTSHCDKYFHNMIINHGKSWFNIALGHMLSQYENQSWSTMVQHHIMANIVSI